MVLLKICKLIIVHVISLHLVLIVRFCVMFSICGLNCCVLDYFIAFIWTLNICKIFPYIFLLTFFLSVHVHSIINMHVQLKALIMHCKHVHFCFIFLSNSMISEDRLCVHQYMNALVMWWWANCDLYWSLQLILL